jgi:hypothetical protein
VSELLCKQCNAVIPREHRVASIAISRGNDESIYSYWRCDACSFYTVRSFDDSFLGDDGGVFFLGAVSKEVGEEIVALIKQCPDRMDQYCDCASHQKLYYGTPRT